MDGGFTMTNSFFTFLSAGEIVFGENALLQLKTKCISLGITKPMVVTTGLKRTDIIPRIREILADCTVYDKVSPEPRSSQALECLDLAKSNGCNGFIGVGGGSPLDLAKVTAVLAVHGGAPRDYIGENNVPGPVAPIVAVPTTAGSGSEVTSVASLAHDEKGDYFKAGLSDNHLRPKVAVVDPLLLKDLPARLTAECGLDALAHGIEAFTAVDYRYVDRPVTSIFNGGNPIAATLAREAISLVFSNLRKAVYQPQNREARYNMSLASLLAGLSFGSAGLGAVHAGYYVVSEKAGTPHSFTVGTLLPHVMRYNMVADPAPYAGIAEIIGVGGKEQDLFGKAAAAVKAVADLVRDLGLPSGLKELNVRKEDIPELAKTAVHHDRLVRGNIRKMSEDDFVKLFNSAL
jgi:alcohol dehydrogenase class IV